MTAEQTAALEAAVASALRDLSAWGSGTVRVSAEGIAEHVPIEYMRIPSLSAYPLARLYPHWYEYLALGKRARVRR